MRVLVWVLERTRHRKTPGDALRSAKYGTQRRSERPANPEAELSEIERYASPAMSAGTRSSSGEILERTDSARREIIVESADIGGCGPRRADDPAAVE